MIGRIGRKERQRYLYFGWVLFWLQTLVNINKGEGDNLLLSILCVLALLRIIIAYVFNEILEKH